MKLDVYIWYSGTYFILHLLKSEVARVSPRKIDYNSRSVELLLLDIQKLQNIIGIILTKFQPSRCWSFEERVIILSKSE
jgi:hypothetical protein